MATVEEAVRKTVESLREVPRKWTEDLETVNDKLANLSNGRHTIRLKVDLEREKASLENSIFKRESGQDLEEYQKVSTMYTKRMKKLKDDKARGEIVDSLINISSSQSHQRYRKRSDLDRAIRMASRTEINELQRHSVIDEFLSDFHSAVPPVYLMHGDMCPNCNEIMKKDTNGGALVCRICGVTSVIQDSTAGVVSFCDDVEYANFTYKRGNHFQEWVNTTMAKQSCEVPKEIIDDVMKTLARDRVSPSDVNARRVRDILKELKLRKWYEHSMRIACTLTGREPPRMTPEMEEKLKLRFSQIQEPFEIFREELLPQRKNFLSYSYVLFKLCELEGLDEFKQCFSLLKGRDKLYKQDQLWKVICEYLNWAFTPSI